MKRRELDAFAAHHGLSEAGVTAALNAARARPSAADLRRFLLRTLSIAGVLSLAAGIVFFVAANWAVLGVYGRFALVEGVLLVAGVLALWRPPPDTVGRFGLLLCFIVTGALLALFGQTYQTGADVYELFLNWALLGMAFAMAASWSVVWAAWLLVLNVALLLFCAARPEAGLFWALVGAFDVSVLQLLLLPLALNVAVWGATTVLEDTRSSGLAPEWLGRFALASGVAFGTWGGLVAILDPTGWSSGVFGLVIPLLVFGGVIMHTMRRRRDVFPLAMIEGSLIVLSTTWIVQAADFDEVETFFVIAAWLVVSSTVSGRYLMHLVRSWERREARG